MAWLVNYSSAMYYVNDYRILAVRKFPTWFWAQGLWVGFSSAQNSSFVKQGLIMNRRKPSRTNPSSQLSESPDPQLSQSAAFDPKDSPFSRLAPLKAFLLAKTAPEPKKKAKKAAPPPKEIDSVQFPAPSDEELFRREMSDVSPLRQRAKRRESEPQSTSSWKPPSEISEDMLVMRDLADLVSGRREFDFSQTDECIEAHVRGFPPGLMNQLRQGRFPIQDHLDLHGLTLQEAQEAISEFIDKSISLGRSCLLLIHGRGHRSPNGIPVIKHNLENLLLRNPLKKYILAFTTARPVDGGSGASYILLRK
jgi:DNA-nicking Smr family endonuclease